VFVAFYGKKSDCMFVMFVQDDNRDHDTERQKAY